MTSSILASRQTPPVEKRKRANTQKITIRDVAAAAGVSPMTVSRVLNKQSNVHDDTRGIVLSAIERLNFAPSLVARRLAGTDHYRIGVLYGNPSVAFLSEFLLGALTECQKTGHQLLVEQCTSGSASEKTALERLLASGVDGLILQPPLCESQWILNRLRRTRTPTVAVGAGQPSDHCASIRIDNYQAAYSLADHLLALGHRRIGVIQGHPNQSVSDLRLRGFLDRLRLAGVAVESGLLAQGYFDYRSGLDAAEFLLQQANRPTAIFAANDDMAAATLAVATRMGLQVPEDLSIAGFDDTPISSTIWPTLTTIRQPIAEMGRSSVQLLLGEAKRMREHPLAEPVSQLLDHHLICRESTARA